MLIHVGYHKTASTWMQRHLFDNRDAGLRMPWTFDEIVDALVRPHPLAWCADTARRGLDAAAPAAPEEDAAPVISCEELSGNPHAGGLQSTTLAHRLAEVFPEARILIVIRRQVDALVSTYKQYVRRGGVLSARRYFEPPAEHFRMPAYRVEHHQYHRLVGLHQRLFGPERVRVLPMERFVAAPREFIADVAAFAGGRDPGPLDHPRERASGSALATAIQRRLNRVLQRDDVNPAGLLRLGRLPYAMVRADRLLAPLSRGADARLRRYVESFARGRFAESNHATESLTGLDLDALGYEV
jgi:hypothetical protein